MPQRQDSSTYLSHGATCTACAEMDYLKNAGLLPSSVYNLCTYPQRLCRQADI